MLVSMRLFAPLCFAMTSVMTASVASAQCPNWRTFAPEGLAGTGSAAVVFDDGSGPDLYVGGDFSAAGDVAANNVARWDGTSWSTLGSGTNGGVHALCVFDDGTGPALYAGGEFTLAGGVSANAIAKWDGAAWSPLGSGMVGHLLTDVMSLLVYDDGTGPALYAGGMFGMAGGVLASRIAKWDGSAWHALGSGPLNGIVFAMAAYDDGTGMALYASGGGGHSIGKWNGSAWSALPTEPNRAVTALAVHDDGSGSALYVGGLFYEIGPLSVYTIARWNGTAWSAVGGGMEGNEVRTMLTFDDGSGPALYAGGGFYGAGGILAERVARWNGSVWSPLGDGMDRYVNAFVVFDAGSGPKLHAVGEFFATGSIPVDGIDTWDGSAWKPLGSSTGMNASVYALNTYDDGSGAALYAGGSFTNAGGTSANAIAKWDGATWAPLGSGVTPAAGNLYARVGAMMVFDDGAGPALFVGGSFGFAGGVSASNVARWDGSNWSPLGGGTSTGVGSFAIFDDGSGPALYAGGVFTSAGGTPANRIAKWDGSTWSPLGSGVSNGSWQANVTDMLVHDDGSGPALYVAGAFLQAGGATAIGIARWDGANWSAVGGSMNDAAYALAVFDDGSGPALYAAGTFSAAGGTSANRIARWNGSSWSALGAGLTNPPGGGSVVVSALKVFDDGSGPALHVGGYFGLAGGQPAANLAKWTGSTWSPLGPGVAYNGYIGSSEVLVLHVHDDGAGVGLWVGGQFGIAGGVESDCLAEWIGCPVVPQAFCVGDGSATACPCGNNGGSGNGCANSFAAAGAHLAASGSARIASDTFVLTASGMSGSTALYIQGTAWEAGGSGTPFGDGLRCAGGNVIRLATKVNSGGGSSYPESGDPAISVRGLIPATGGSRTYQAWYRNVAGPCGSGFNLTNAVLVGWAP